MTTEILPESELQYNVIYLSKPLSYQVQREPMPKGNVVATHSTTGFTSITLATLEAIVILILSPEIISIRWGTPSNPLPPSGTMWWFFKGQLCTILKYCTWWCISGQEQHSDVCMLKRHDDVTVCITPVSHMMTYYQMQWYLTMRQHAGSPPLTPI